MFKKIKKGITLTEVLFVLVIMAMLLLVIFNTYKNQMNDAKAKQMIQEVNMILEASTSIYSGEENYSGISMNVLSDSNALPSRLQHSTSFINPFSGNYQLSSINSVSGTSDILQLTASYIPSTVCTRIVAGTAPNLYMVYINGTAASLTPKEDSSGWNRYNVNFGQVSSLCNNKVNTLSFQKLKLLNTKEYVNPTLNALTDAQTSYISSERTRIKAAMDKRESIQNSL